MNVLVVNQQENVISSLNVEVIKTLRGTFTADELIGTFTNFFFAQKEEIMFPAANVF